MNMPILHQIEQEVKKLSPSEQLWLIERLAHQLRDATWELEDFEASLAVMAADPAIQRELKEIEAEFAETENDGLEKI
jgi:hypothetical protein